MNNIGALAAVPAALLGMSGCGQQKPERPNIIFIMTDDHTTQAMSCYGGNLVQTPNMDRLAREGMRFDNCYAVNALSGPSRACILTGKFSHVNGFTDNACTFDGDQQTLPKLLQQAGYQTAVIGKWHLISEPQGFDFWSILTGQEEQGDYYDPDFNENGRHITEKGYVTDIITDKALDFIDHRDPSKPFFMMFHHKAPHRNWMPAPRHLGMFNDTVFPEPENLLDDYAGRGRAAREQDMNLENTFTEDWDLKLLTREEMLADTTNRLYKVYRRMPAEVREKWDSVYAGRIAEYRSGKLRGDELVRWKYQQYMRDYLATAMSVDESIGRLLDHLEETGELDNTIIVYTSDQGFFLGEHGWFDKRFMYEECQRMPLLVRYPKAVSAGSVSDAICMNVDFAPTFLDYAGIPVPEYMQGKSIRNVAAGNTPKDWRKSFYYRYWQNNEVWHKSVAQMGIRTHRWKLIFYYARPLGKTGAFEYDTEYTPHWELYDMKRDPHENTNAYGLPKYRKITEKLKRELWKLKENVDDTEDMADPEMKRIYETYYW